MFTRTEGNFHLFLFGGFLFVFLSLMFGRIVGAYTISMIYDTWWVWPSAGATTGFILSLMLSILAMEDDPLGVLTFIIGVTLCGATFSTLLISIGWLEWKAIYWMIGFI